MKYLAVLLMLPVLSLSANGPGLRQAPMPMQAPPINECPANCDCNGSCPVNCTCPHKDLPQYHPRSGWQPKEFISESTEQLIANLYVYEKMTPGAYLLDNIPITFNIPVEPGSYKIVAVPPQAPKQASYQPTYQPTYQVVCNNGRCTLVPNTTAYTTYQTQQQPMYYYVANGGDYAQMSASEGGGGRNGFVRKIFKRIFRKGGGSTGGTGGCCGG